jgi:alpha-L-fucosidase
MTMRRVTPSLVLVACTLLPGTFVTGEPYKPTWESLDSRPNPAWFNEAKFGIFIHWGVYSVPSWSPKGEYSEWYWNSMGKKDGATWKFHVQTYGEKFKYQDFAPMFKAELFDAKQWADVFKRSGAKYIVLTSKHHDGFCLWPSPQSWNWNSMDIGPHRDLCGELTEAVRAAGIRMGFYYSLYEWFNPLYLSDPKRYVDEHMLPQIKDLVTRYKPDIVWPDGEWEHPSDLWRSREFLTWLFNDSPAAKDVAINDRWGKDCRSHHGGYYTTEYGKYHEMSELGATREWEECRGMGGSFGYSRNEGVDDYKPAGDLIHLLIETVSKGGSLLLDIGPTADGRIPVIMQQRLVDMGEWLKVNGEAIYGTRAWRKAKESDKVRFTLKGKVGYAICLAWPEKELVLEVPKPTGEVTLLGYSQPLKSTYEGGKLRIEVPSLSVNQMPCRYTYVFKLSGVE